MPYIKGFSYIYFYAPTPQMVEHTQTIRRQFTNELFECVCPFFGLALIFNLSISHYRFAHAPSRNVGRL